MDLSPPHLHLLLNHFPSIGFIVGIGLFVAALVSASDHLTQASLVVLVGIALLTIPAHVTGNAAAQLICIAEPSQPCADASVSRSLIEYHEDAAVLSSMLMMTIGCIAWLALWQYRRARRMAAWSKALILVLSCVTLAAVSHAANLGGEIRHPEIRPAAEAAVGNVPLGSLIRDYVRDHPWVWIASETLHFVGLTVLIGVVLVIQLRMTGMLKALSCAALDRLLPWAIAGFYLNVFTGMLFFVASPDYYTMNVAFYWKLIFVLGAGVNTLYFLFDRGWAAESERTVPRTSRWIAASALALWVGVMFWGSMLPFLGNSF